MKKLTYNLDAAIYMRSTTATVLEDSYGNPAPVDFKLSITLAKDEMFMYGWDYDQQAELGFGDRRNVTREEYKKQFNSLRRYYYDLSKNPDYNTAEDICPNA